MAPKLEYSKMDAADFPPRTLWANGFPAVTIHATVAERDRHPCYAKAKAGDTDDALSLAQDLVSPEACRRLRQIVGAEPATLLPVTAIEVAGFNAIPDAVAQVLGQTLGWPVSSGEIVQANKVGHTRARAFNRMVTPAVFEGRVYAGTRYVLVDDHVGLGGTLANLKGFVEHQGGFVAAMTTLTESREASQIVLHADTRNMLWQRHGQPLDQLWRFAVGHGLDCLTNVEAAILCREPSVDAIRDRLAQAAIEARGRGLNPVVAVDD